MSHLPFIICLISLYSLSWLPRVLGCLPSLQQACFCVLCCNSLSTTTSTSKPLSHPYDTSVCQRLTKKQKRVFLLLKLLSGLRHSVSAVLTFLEPGEQIAQIFSMRPRNRKKTCTQENYQDLETWLSGCQMLLLILLASLFELCLTSNIHRDRWLTWGEERLSAAERIRFSPSYIHLLKPSLIEEILLTAQSTSAHYVLMISPLFQSVLFDYTSTDTTSLHRTQLKCIRITHGKAQSSFLSEQESRDKSKEYF